MTTPTMRHWGEIDLGLRGYWRSHKTIRHPVTVQNKEEASMGLSVELLATIIVSSAYIAKSTEE